MLTVYKASAGSGKTYTLTKTYLRLLLGVKEHNGKYRLNHSDFGPVLSNRHRRILAITFTNKATEEMKSRIIDRLNTLANPETAPTSEYAKEFTTEFGCTIQQLSQTAAMSIKSLLTNYSDFNVTTIDSFFQTVLRAMAFELDYPGDYEVVLESDAVVAEAVTMMLDDFNGSMDDSLNSPVAKALLDFMREERNENGKFNIFNRRSRIFRNMVNSAKSLFDERYHLVADDFEKWLADPDSVPKLTSILKNWEEKIISRIGKEYDKFLEILNDNELAYTELVAPISKRLDEISDKPETKIEALSQKTFLKIYQDNEYQAKTLFKSKTASLKNCDDQTARQLHILFRQIARNIVRLYDLKVVYNGVSTYRFMKVLTDNIRRFSDDRNIIVLADTNRLLNGVMDKGNVPFVYEKIGNYLSNFLIDEFQDTSRMQWQNLIPLVENGLSEGNDSLIIGDEKQSIYRFRNSDSSLLHHEVAQHFGSEVEPKGLLPEENTNWRSSGVIVSFNNKLFTELANAYGISGYENICQAIAPKHTDEDGYIRFYPFPTKKNKDDKESEEEVLPTDVDVMIDEIKRQHNSGYAWRDIAVLVATNSSCQDYGQVLLAAGIPIATEEALLVRANPSVALIVSTLQIIVDSAEQSGKNAAADRRAFNSQFSFLYNQNLQKGEAPNNAAINAIHNIFYNKDINTDAGAIADLTNEKPASLSELVEIIISKRISPADRLRDMAFLAAFQDAVIQFSANLGNNLVEFLRWWTTISLRLSVATPDNNDAVRIMTIHKAKGLEFDCVHLPKANTPLFDSHRSESVWIETPKRLQLTGLPPALHVGLTKSTSSPFSYFHKHYQQNRNARATDGLNRNYVAYTRPAREMCVYYNPDKDFGSQLRDILSGFKGFNPEDSSLIIGAPTRPLPVSSEKQEELKMRQEAAFSLNSYDIYDQHRLQVLAEIDNNLDKNPTGVDYNTPTDDDGDTARRTAAIRGTAMHFAFGSLNARNADLKTAMERAIRRARRRGLLPADEDKLRNLVSDPEIGTALQGWFCNSYRVMSEIPLFTGSENEEFITDDTGVLRPDLLVWHDADTIEIVDFKFTAEVERRHMEQVRDYAARLRRMYPDATLSATLLYADLHRLVNVPL